MNKIYFKVFLAFFILILIGGGVFFGIREKRRERMQETEPFDGLKVKEEVLPSLPPVEEPSPLRTGSLPTLSPAANLKEFELSSSGKIGQFASDWDWALRRSQDGRFAETRLGIEINLEREIREAILVFNPVYSGEGEGEYEVYINDKKQVVEKDEDHNFSSWWVGDEVELGEKLREESWSCSGQEEFQAWEVTDFVRSRGGGEYFVAFLNRSKAGISASEVYLRVVYK